MNLPKSADQKRFLLKCGIKAFNLSLSEVPLVMGILNLTPDSFWDGGRYTSLDAALYRAEEMLIQGASILDIGGESSRPRGAAYGRGARALSVEEEKERILPVIEAIIQRFPDAVLSVDTYKSEVAKAAVEAGATMLNDITALRFDPKMADVAAQFNVPLVLMHSVGMPGEMPHIYPNACIVEEVKQSLQQAVDTAKQKGVQQLVLDAGFGFGKTPHDNLTLLAATSDFVEMGYPVLVGISRKNTIGIILGSSQQPVPAEERLFATLGATAVAVMQGAKIIRVHDVRETVEYLKGLQAVLNVAL